MQHLACDLGGMGAGDSVDADQEQELGMIGGSEDDGESVSGAVMRVRTRRGAGFDEDVRPGKGTPNCGAGPMLCGFGHAVENLTDRKLVAVTSEFGVGACHAQGRSAPVVAYAGEFNSGSDA